MIYGFLRTQVTIGDINSYWALTLLAHDSKAEVDTRFEPKVTLAPGRVEVTAHWGGPRRSGALLNETECTLKAPAIGWLLLFFIR